METGRTPSILPNPPKAAGNPPGVYGPFNGEAFDADMARLDRAAASAFVWYVVRTNPQCEDRAQASLEAAGFISFLPKMRKETRHPRTKVWRVRAYPLMTRYLFLGMSTGQEHWGHVRGCDGVECVLGVNGLPVRVPSRDVEALIDAQAKGRFDQMRRSSVKRPYRLQEPVMMTEGPFQGFHGNVNDYHGKRMIEVMIAIFGRLTPVTVDMSAVRAA
jgi:transcriptional antiterminator RfaH